MDDLSRIHSSSSVRVVKKWAALAAASAALSLAACSQDSAQQLPPTSVVPTTSAAPVAPETEPATTTTAAAPTSAAPTTEAASPATTSPADAAVPDGTDGLTVLYAGHSFGRPFAENMTDATRLAGIDGHEQRVVFRGGENGAPQAMWDDPDVRALIREELDDGAVDVVILICCSAEFRETANRDDQAVSDQAILEIVAYAVERNPETRFGLAMPWMDFPNQYATAADHRALIDAAYPLYQQLAESISEASNGVDIFTFFHGAAVYEVRSRFEQGLIPELTNLIGPRRSSVFTDEKGHAANMAIDAGTLIWLEAIYDVHPLDVPPIAGYDVDIREIAATALATAP